jgi:hypothetical protein
VVSFNDREARPSGFSEKLLNRQTGTELKRQVRQVDFLLDQMLVGVVIPPMAICVFVVKQITNTPFNVIYAGVYPFLISLVVGGIILFFFPGIATWLLSVLMPG